MGAFEAHSEDSSIIISDVFLNDWFFIHIYSCSLDYARLNRYPAFTSPKQIMKHSGES